jgi:hypothetical protein
MKPFLNALVGFIVGVAGGLLSTSTLCRRG